MALNIELEIGEVNEVLRALDITRASIGNLTAKIKAQGDAQIAAMEKAADPAHDGQTNPPLNND
jgi:hypothetical protein